MSDAEDVRSKLLPEGMDPRPIVTVFPKCSECNLAFILRRCYRLGTGGSWDWLWMRDCKHKRADHEIVVPEIDGQGVTDD